jgi:hypothetical protein
MKLERRNISKIITNNNKKIISTALQEQQQCFFSWQVGALFLTVVSNVATANLSPDFLFRIYQINQEQPLTDIDNRRNSISQMVKQAIFYYSHV